MVVVEVAAGVFVVEAAVELRRERLWRLGWC